MGHELCMCTYTFTPLHKIKFLNVYIPYHTLCPNHHCYCRLFKLSYKSIYTLRIACCNSLGVSLSAYRTFQLSNLQLVFPYCQKFRFVTCHLLITGTLYSYTVSWTFTSFIRCANSCRCDIQCIILVLVHAVVLGFFYVFCRILQCFFCGVGQVFLVFGAAMEFSRF